MDKKMIYEEYRMLMNQKTQLQMQGREFDYSSNNRIDVLRKLLDDCYKIEPETKQVETFPEPPESPF